MKKTKDGKLILVINILKILITLAFTLYRVEWEIIDSFTYLVSDIFFAFFRNLITPAFIIYLFAEWCITLVILYFLSEEKDTKTKRKHAFFGGMPFFCFFYGWHLNVNKKTAI